MRSRMVLTGHLRHGLSGTSSILCTNQNLLHSLAPALLAPNISSQKAGDNALFKSIPSAFSRELRPMSVLDLDSHDIADACSHYGEAVKPGPYNVQPSAAACCDSCVQFKPKTSSDSPCNGRLQTVPSCWFYHVLEGAELNESLFLHVVQEFILILKMVSSWVCYAVWVWCGDKVRCKENYQHCWLKYMPWLYSSKPKQGPEVPWTTGLMQAPPMSSTQSLEEQGGAKRRYHTVTTAQGATTHWQMRIHYYWFKKQQKRCREQHGDSCHMGGFTRILHSGRDDDLSAEIPTYVAKPLPSGPGNYVVRAFFNQLHNVN